MSLQLDQIIEIAGFSYVGALVGSLWWYGTRRSTPARYMLALLMFLPAGLCFLAALSMFGAMAGSAHHTPDAVSDSSGLVSIIALGACGVGAMIAFFGVRVLTKPLPGRKGHPDA